MGPKNNSPAINYWVLIYRFAWCLLIVICVVIGICLFTPQIQRVREFNRKIVELEQNISELEAEIRELRKNQELFCTDSNFVERIGKESGLLKPGETVFKFTDEKEPQ